jgi:FkbM family methyltransferase
VRKAVQSIVQKLLLKRGGLVVIPEWRADRWEMARHVRAVVDLLQVECVLDVGANAGQYYDFLRTEVGYRGRVVSFEPIPSLVQALQARNRDRDWTICNCALGSEPAVRPFNVMAKSEFSSFLEPDHSQVDEFTTANRVRDRIDVTVRRLDAALGELEVSAQRIFLKLDTQGYDLEVISGIGNDLERIAAISIEASVRPIYRGMPDYLTALGVLDNLGFDLSGMFPVTRDAAQRLIEIDCVGVRRALLPGALAADGDPASASTAAAHR